MREDIQPRGGLLQGLASVCREVAGVFLMQVKNLALTDRLVGKFPRPQSGSFQRLSIRALVITLTELSAIAPPAITGLR